MVLNILILTNVILLVVEFVMLLLITYSIITLVTSHSRTGRKKIEQLIKEHPELIMTKSDKRNVTVIMYKQQYIDLLKIC